MGLQGFFSSMHAFLYRRSSGKIGGTFRGAPCLPLPTTGNKTGRKRTTPVLYMRDGNRLVIVASNSGRKRSPLWWTNLRYDPRAEVQIMGGRWTVKAEKASDSEKDRLWPMLTKMFQPYEGYQKKTKRVIPVVILTPLDASSVEIPGIGIL